VKSWKKIDKNLTDCPPCPSDVATVHWEIEKKVIFSIIIITYFWLVALSHKKTICNPLAHCTWKCHTLSCELQNCFICLKVCCVLSDVGGSEKSQLWVVVSGSEKNRLCWVATGMSGKQYHRFTASVQSDHLLHHYMLPVFFDNVQSCSTPHCPEFQPTSQQAAAASLSTSTSTCAPLVDTVLGLCR